MRIEDILARRSDLSTFLVHLTRSGDSISAKDRLKQIVHEKKLKVSNPFGHAVQRLSQARLPTDSQRCVCFTETPLEHVALLLGEIEGRSFDFEPYGIAITKKQGRQLGVNPVWYVDITPAGHDWLSNSINKLVETAIATGNFDESPVAKITPFIEQMGSSGSSSGAPYRKEFWWEREWRHVGDLSLPKRFIILCPGNETGAFDTDSESKFIDPAWSLEQIIANLAGFNAVDIGPF